MELVIKLMGAQGNAAVILVDGTPVGLIKHLHLELDIDHLPQLRVQFGSYHADNPEDQARIDAMLAANKTLLRRLPFAQVVDSDTVPQIDAVPL